MDWFGVLGAPALLLGLALVIIGAATGHGGDSALMAPGQTVAALGVLIVFAVIMLAGVS